MKKKIPPKERLRTGYTTGACAAAAASAAALGLLEGKVPETVTCQLPNLQQVTFHVEDGHLQGNHAHAVICKDAGDDPDCTHGARITADVIRKPGKAEQIQILGGRGVGQVTLSGLGLTVGGPAINPVPMANIQMNVRTIAHELLINDGLDVTISVPGGEEMAKQTLNARLGILGGISILGTTGIVKPYSTSAFRASVIQGIQVAAKQGNTTIVLTTGGRTESFVMKALPTLAPACFIQMGDFLSYALDTAVECQLQDVVIGGMVGKLTKMAQGETITHAGRAQVNTGLLADIAEEIGAATATCEAIRAAPTARFASETMAELGLSDSFHRGLANRVVTQILKNYPDTFRLRVLMCDFNGEQIAEADSTHLTKATAVPANEQRAH